MLNRSCNKLNRIVKYCTSNKTVQTAEDAVKKDQSKSDASFKNKLLGNNDVCQLDAVENINCTVFNGTTADIPQQKLLKKTVFKYVIFFKI